MNNQNTLRFENPNITGFIDKE